MTGTAVDADRTSALGVAVFAFAALEWEAIRCCERIKPGSTEELQDRTAGRVADTLNHLAKSPDAPGESEVLLDAASDFRAYVGTRNNLLHSRPGFDAAGRPRLYRDGDQWTLEELRAVALAFTKCSERLALWLQTSGSAV